MSGQLNGQLDGAVRRWRRYPAYKDSGSRWVMELPTGWKVCKARQLGRMLKGAGGTKEDAVAEGVPCVRYGDLYTTHEYKIAASRTCVTPDKAANYTPIQYGDVLFAASGETLADIGKSAVNLMSGSACCGGDLIVLRPSISVHAPFLGYAMDCSFASAQKASMGRGTTVKHVYPSEVRNLLVFLPSLAEQEAIASFLAAETAKIDALIAKKERLIELLQEKRTALVSHAVTEGLDASVPTKDSGIEWLGKVPAHWDVSSLGRYIRGIEQGWSPVADDRTAEAGEWGVIKLGAVSKGRFRSSEHKALPTGVTAQERYEVRDGDFLLTRANTPELVGDVCIVHSPRPRLMLCDLVYRVRLNESRVNKVFLARWLLSLPGRYQITREARGSSQSMVKIAQGHICSFVVVLPPPAEQQTIVAFLDRETARLDALLAKVRHAIDKLCEFRTALISAAVTGKIDLREEGRT